MAVGDNIFCRICLYEGNHENPLISICNCIGALKHTHIECLRRCINSRFTEESVVKKIKFINCEICKKSLPFFIKVNSISYELLKFKCFDMPYLAIQMISKYCKNDAYFVGFNKVNSVIIGSNKSADLWFNYVSVSNYHAKIKFVNNEFIIEDNGSKLGTMVLLNESKVIDEKFVIQCDRTIMEFSKEGFEDEQF